MYKKKIVEEINEVFITLLKDILDSSNDEITFSIVYSLVSKPKKKEVINNG